MEMQLKIGEYHKKLMEMGVDVVECERCHTRFKFPYYRCLECGANTVYLIGKWKGKKVIDILNQSPLD